MQSAASSSNTALRQKLDYDSVLSAIAINVLTLAMPLAMMQVFDRVIPNQSYGTLIGIFMALMVVLTLDFALKVTRASYVLHAARQHGHMVQAGLSNAVFEGDARALNTLGAEGTIEKLMSLLGLRRSENEQMVKLVIDHVFSGLFLLIIWALAGWIVVVPILVMILLFLVAMKSEPQFRQASQHRRDYAIRRMSFLSEVLNQVQLIKLLGLEQPMLRRYEMLHASMSVASRKIVQLHGLCYGAASLGSQLVTVLTCAFGAMLAIQGQLTIAELAACMLLTSRAVQPVIQLAFLTSVKDDADQRTDGLSEVIATYSGDTRHEETTATGGVMVRGLGLCLPGAQGYRFQDVSFTAHRGDLVVIDGPMTSQPTSILKMIAGELSPDAGRIEVEGVGQPGDQTLPPVGLVFEPREPVIFNGSILENLTAFVVGPSDTAENDIAVQLGLSAQIARLPAGVRTQLMANHRDTGSPGFYKRISLGRALNAAPRVLLLADPFAFLDPAGQRNLEAVLLTLKGDVTVILTRPSAAILQAADQVLQLSPTLSKTAEDARFNAMFNSTNLTGEAT